MDKRIVLGDSSVTVNTMGLAVRLTAAPDIRSKFPTARSGSAEAPISRKSLVGRSHGPSLTVNRSIVTIARSVSLIPIASS